MGGRGDSSLLSLAAFLYVVVVTLGSELNFTSGPRVSIAKTELRGVLVWTDPSVAGDLSVKGCSSLLLELGDLLLLGGRDAIHVFNASNVTQHVSPIRWAPLQSEREDCRSKGPEMEECANYIRVLHRLNDSHLITCGTHAFNPQCAYIRTTPRPLQLLPAVESGRGRCPHSPSQGAASVVLDGELYTATSNNFLNTEYVISRSLGGRTPLKTELRNDWLNHPDFVFSGEVRESVGSDDGDDDKVYVFFSERDKDTRATLASVARVCKGDLGGLKALQKRWSSFLKARVECTLPGSPGPLQRIRSVFYHQPTSTSWKDGVFYGVFESQGPWGPVSALCPLPMSQLRAAFLGPYREFLSDSKCWSTRSTNIPSPRPGSCITNTMRYRGIKNSTDLPEQTLTFALEHPLMSQAVTPEGSGGPVLVAPPGLRYSQVALLRVMDAKGIPRDLVFLGTDSGLLHKVLLGRAGQPPHIIEELHLFSDGQPISSLQISQDKTRLFVGGERSVAQVALTGGTCKHYPSCTDCVLARDPLCAWEPVRGCVGVRTNSRAHSRIQDVENGDVAACMESVDASAVTRVLAPLGGSTFLPCPMPSAHAREQWLHQGQPPLPSEPATWRALPDGLLLLALGPAHAGRYECSALERRSSRAVAAFSLSVSGDDWALCDPESSHAEWAGDATGGSEFAWIVTAAVVAGTSLLALLVVVLVRRKRRSRRQTISESGQSRRYWSRQRENRHSRVPLVGSEDVALLGSHRLSQRHSGVPQFAGAPQFAGVTPLSNGSGAVLLPNCTGVDEERGAKRHLQTAFPLPPPPPSPPAIRYREWLVKVTPRHGSGGEGTGGVGGATASPGMLSIVAGMANVDAPLVQFGEEEGTGSLAHESTV